jgi:DNA (cytosine-5)-methyltransferase 1
LGYSSQLDGNVRQIFPIAAIGTKRELLGTFVASRYCVIAARSKAGMATKSYVSLFSGAGGLDLGLEAAGWHCQYASDIDDAAVQTLQGNAGKAVWGHRVLADTFIESADVSNLTGSSVLSKAGLTKGSVDLLAGGPPCQSWSSAGKQRGFDDPRGQLFNDFIRLANELDVRSLVFENVRGLLTARGPDGLHGSALLYIREKLRTAGFQTAVTLLNAADYGVPQRRVRLFVVGYRSGDEPAFPHPTHTSAEDQRLLPWITLGDALSKLHAPSGDEVILPTASLEAQLRQLQPGKGVKSPGKPESTRPGGHWGYKQGAFLADPKLPARTVTANQQQDWVLDELHGIRRLCPRECAALQSFPEDWTFAGNRGTQYRLVGNAVPPLLARAVGEALLLRADVRSESPVDLSALLPLPVRLEGAIKYAIRDDQKNGHSRKVNLARRPSAEVLAAE